MSAAEELFPTHQRTADEDQHVVLNQVPWSMYVMLRDTLDGPGLRMTYLQGALEIMSPSRTHEVNKKQIARLLEIFCLERDIPLFGYGSTTFRKEEVERGLEPDECYSRGSDKDVPDLAIEVVVTRGTLNKLEVYRGLGIREVWVYEKGAFRLFQLKGNRYAATDTSEVLPEVDFDRLAHYAQQQDQHAALKAWRDELRG